jgi:hypothetical protein
MIRGRRVDVTPSGRHNAIDSPHATYHLFAGDTWSLPPIPLPNNLDGAQSDPSSVRLEWHLYKADREHALILTVELDLSGQQIQLLVERAQTVALGPGIYADNVVLTSGGVSRILSHGGIRVYAQRLGGSAADVARHTGLERR